MQKTLFILITTAALFTSRICEASGADGEFYVFNDTSCGQYAEDRKLPRGVGENGKDKVYIAGWLSAYNAYQPNTYSITNQTDIESAMLWLDNYCHENPLSSLQVGLIYLTKQLYPNRAISRLGITKYQRNNSD